MAARSGAAAATVSRLGTRLGYSGFPAFRSAIALDNGRTTQSGWERDIGSAISPADSPDDVLDILAGTAARSLRDAADAIDVRPSPPYPEVTNDEALSHGLVLADFAYERAS